ncbi:MAG: ComEC/Rec2 family competence protein, partial [Acidimicrobiales bacterium]
RFMAKEVADDFRTTGLSHLLAVSGANVAIVVAAAVLLARALRSSRRAQVAWGLAAVGFFSVVTRWEPSVLRATLMSSVALAAFFFGRRSDPLHALALAFVGLLALDPFLLWSIGFQLSFAATLGILTITPLVVGRLRRVPRPVAEALGVGIGAQAAVTPLLVFHFGRISLVAVPANLAAAPLVAPATILGLTGGVLGLVWEPLGLLAFKLAGLPTVGLRGIAQALAGLPQAVLPVPPLGAIQVVAAYAMLAGAVWWLVGRGRRGRVPVAVGLAAYLLAALAPVGASRPPKGLSLTFFDVGQGDAALVESRGGARILIDGGPERDYLAGRLSRRGVDRLDLVAFSHAHADHVNGLSAVLSRFQVRAAIHPGVMT